MKEENVLKHFTNVSVLFKILKGGFRFSDGQNWDDRNDYNDIKVYSSANDKNILILCFCDGEGNVYHWNSLGRKKNNDQYANIKCSIVLDKCRFLQHVESLGSEYRHRDVIYCHNNEILQKRFSDIPFLKRKEFEVENEYRIIYEGLNDNAMISGIKPFINKIVIGVCSQLEYETIRLKLTSEHHIPLERIAQNKLTDSEDWNIHIKQLARKINRL